MPRSWAATPAPASTLHSRLVSRRRPSTWSLGLLNEAHHIGVNAGRVPNIGLLRVGLYRYTNAQNLIFFSLFVVKPHKWGFSGLIVHKQEPIAVAEIGDRLATIDMGRKVGTAVPLSGEGELGPTPHLTQRGLAEAYLRTKWHLDPSSRLVTTDVDRKVGVLC